MLWTENLFYQVVALQNESTFIVNATDVLFVYFLSKKSTMLET